MNAFITFNRGMLKLPIAVQLWVMAQLAVNAIIPLFYLDRLEAKVVFGTFVVSFLLMVLITGVTGFTRVLGAGHILWIPMLVYLWSQLDHIPSDDFFGYWIRALIIINAASLVVDAIDVMRYIRGNHTDMVTGL